MPPSASTAYLLMDVAGTPCALPGSAIREILPLPHLHAPPESGGALLGFVNLAGEPLAVIDLANLLGLRSSADPDPYRHLVVLAGSELALLVDRALALAEIDPDLIRPVESSQTLNGSVAAEIALDGRLVHALSPSRILTEQEAQRIAAHARRAAERLAALGPVE